MKDLTPVDKIVAHGLVLWVLLIGEARADSLTRLTSL